ncbi:hypothetical protein [Myroides odoratimimus]|uniref:hypothetical protein n=1 Tax=Myroides odoratimimus TaxID=76832 RepID=UPI0025763851|nr:hypothetical protein [Myroides odoratimimus]MDM1453942.1 hypothetical protein [Myroides odoratimimus]MDM1477664.1 hypothetical protein [Myroides odoratimimus]MDM1490338.1 hypothetical protein [Myroides odoratimimus]
MQKNNIGIGVMKNMMLIVIFLISYNSVAQKSYLNYVPKNWKIVSTAKGDLNKDGIEDLVLVIKNTDASNVIKNESLGQNLLDTNPREVLVFFKDKSHNYRLVERNSKGFVPSENSVENPCLSDPFDEVSIVNNILIWRFNYWSSCGTYFSSNMTYKFRYQHNNFELIGADYYQFSRSTGEGMHISINFSIKKKEVTTGLNEFGSENPVVEKSSIKIGELYKLRNCNENTYSEVLEF